MVSLGALRGWIWRHRRSGFGVVSMGSWVAERFDALREYVRVLGREAQLSVGVKQSYKGCLFVFRRALSLCIQGSWIRIRLIWFWEARFSAGSCATLLLPTLACIMERLCACLL